MTLFHGARALWLGLVMLAGACGNSTEPTTDLVVDGPAPAEMCGAGGVPALAACDLEDGSTIWRTQYPAVEFPRMTGVRANSVSVFVAFSSIRSGGD